MSKRPTTSSQSGCLSTIVFIVVGGTLLGLIGEFQGENGAESKIINAILLIIFGVVAFAVRNAILENIKSKTESANELLQNDPRAPVLYLRSFDSDQDTYDTYTIGENLARINPYFLLGRAIYNRPTFEQQLAYTLNQVGPFIALSAPNSHEIDLGASKLTTITSDWQKVVNDYLDKCSLIIMRVGSSNGLLWEIEQIARKEYLDKLVIYIQFSGPQDNELIEARFRKFGQIFSKLTGVTYFQKIEKNHYLYFKNRQPKLAKLLSRALNDIGCNVEKSNYRGRMKGMWPGADNSFRRPASVFETMPGGFRYFLYFLFSTLVVSILYSIIASIISIWINCPGTLTFAMLFLMALFGGVAIGRISVLLNVAGGLIHTLWGFVLMFLSEYVYCSVLWRSWDFFGTLNSAGAKEFDICAGLFISLGAFIFIPLICYIYAWSDAEQKLSVNVPNTNYHNSFSCHSIPPPSAPT